MKKIENIKKVLSHMEKEPNRNFLRTALLLATGDDSYMPRQKERVIARKFLGISWREADYYFNINRNPEELRTIVEPFFDKDGYGKDGYDRKGYDREGFDTFGFDIEGYSRHGYDGTGYDREGYNRAGYNRLGYNREGYDKNGFDRFGYDKYGYDYDGLDKNNKPKSETNKA